MYYDKKNNYPFFDVKSHLLYDTEPFCQCAQNIGMAVTMANDGCKQGCTHIIATPPHTAFLNALEDPNADGVPDSILRKLHSLNLLLGILLPEVKVLLGCELLCDHELLRDHENIVQLIQHLKKRHLPTLNGSEYVLVSFQDDVSLEDIWFCCDQLKDAGFEPVLSHAETLTSLKWNLGEIESLKGCGPRDNTRHKFHCKIQVNTSSLHFSNQDQAWVRELIRAGVVDVMGSDARNTSTHPVHIQQEAERIASLCTPDYLKAITFENAKAMFGDTPKKV